MVIRSHYSPIRQGVRCIVPGLRAGGKIDDRLTHLPTPVPEGMPDAVAVVRIERERHRLCLRIPANVERLIAHMRLLRLVARATEKDELVEMMARPRIPEARIIDSHQPD